MLQISVVIPAFNAANTIARAVTSILDQTLQDLELIVVDDGSTDETLSILNEIQDERLRVVSIPHAGVASAANVGTVHAAALLIARMDADDFAYPHRLQKQLEQLHREQLDIVGCHVNIVGGNNEPVESMQNYQRWINEETLTSSEIAALRFVEFPVVNPTILARREYFELEYRSGDFPEDYDLFLRSMAKGMKCGKVAEVLMDWSDSSTRLTRTSELYSAAAFDRCRRMHLLEGPLAGVREVDVWGVGQTGKPWLRWLQEANFSVRCAYDVSPRKQGETIHGATVRHPVELPDADGTPMIVAVGAPGARQVISPQLIDKSYRLGEDAWFVA
jgi:hypothetical protein